LLSSGKGNPYHHPPTKRKELIKMKVIVYVNWREEEIITEKEYKEKMTEVKKDKEIFDDYKSSYLNDYIEEFIDKSPHPLNFETVFNLTEAERQKILDEVREGYENQVEEEFSDEWEEVEIDI
jgi:hypothetical protein